MSAYLEIRTFADEHQTDGESNFSELLLEYFSSDELRKSLVASDMDGTMFPEDIGRHVFLEKLGDPSFWTFSVEKFKRLLLPITYEKIIRARLNNQGTVRINGGKVIDINALNKDICLTILLLWEDIVCLYTAKKQAQKQGLNGNNQLANNAIVNEFARKMIEFDNLVFHLDDILSSLLNKELLLRTRFFAGKNLDMVRDITRKVMEKTRDEGDQITLKTHEKNKKHADQIIELPDLVVTRVIRINASIHHALTELGLFRGSDIRVVTTNLQRIATTALKMSPYFWIKEGRKNAVLGTMQKKKRTQRLQARTKGSPLLGNQKVKKLESVQIETGKKLKIVFGDSPSNDSPMGIQALQNGGFFGITGSDYESTREKFERFFYDLGVQNEEIKKLLLTQKGTLRRRVAERIIFFPEDAVSRNSFEDFL